MPPRKKLPITSQTSSSTVTTESFDDWDQMVSESKIDSEPYTIRRRVVKDGEEHFEFIVIPVPSGAAYVNLNAAQQRVDVAGILLNLTTSGKDETENSELFVKLMEMLGEADFPVVDLLATRVLTHYFNPAPKDSKGKPGGPGESSAS